MMPAATYRQDGLIIKILMAVVACALVATVATVLLANERGGSLSASAGVTSPSIHQAPWKTHVFPAGALGGVGKKDMSVVKAQAKPVIAVVERSLDALVLDPASSKDVLHRTFSAAAADHILGSHFGAPAGASNLKTTTRTAQIGIQAHGARAAAADVKIAFTATVRGHTAAVAQKATLWLERSHHAWHVVGFAVDQGPAANHKRSSGHKRSSAHKAHKKKRR